MKAQISIVENNKGKFIIFCDPFSKQEFVQWNTEEKFIKYETDREGFSLWGLKYNTKNLDLIISTFESVEFVK
jgi:hypothetical protein